MKMRIIASSKENLEDATGHDIVDKFHNEVKISKIQTPFGNYNKLSLELNVFTDEELAEYIRGKLVLIPKGMKLAYIQS